MKKFNNLLLLTVAALGIAACGNTADSSRNSTSNSEEVAIQPISTTVNGELASLDNIISTDVPSLAVIGNAFEGLYRPSADGRNELGVAAEEPEVSEDGLTYTFKIRDNANWSNGDPVTAEDFAYTYQKAVKPETAAGNVNKFFAIENAEAISLGKAEVDTLGVTAIDDKILEFQLANPTPYFKDLLATSYYAPQNAKVASKLGTDYGTSADRAVYNGPFVVTDWTGTEIEWSTKKNPEYWDAGNVKAEQVDWIMSKENATNVNLFEAGELQHTAITSPYVEQFQDNEALQTSPKGLVGYLQFNFSSEPTNNEHFRKAISMSYDKDAFVNTILADGSTAVDGWVPAAFATNIKTDEDFRETNGNLNAYNVEEAQKEWELAKEELGVDTLEIELLTSDTETSKSTSEYLQAEWQRNLPGLTVTIRNVPLKSRQAITGTREYDIVYGTYAPSYSDPTAFLDYFESTSNLNGGDYVSEAYDQHLEDARTIYANDPQKRWESLLAAEQILIEEDAAVAPIYQGAFANLVSPELEGVINQTTGSELYFRNASYAPTE